MCTATEKTYWERRQHFKYYKLVKYWIHRLSPGDSILDIGSGGTPIASWGHFKSRYSVDTTTPFEHDFVAALKMSWMDFKIRRRFSVITCLQVLEHLDDNEIEPFVSKMNANADVIILSVPHMWNPAWESEHKQDPIDAKKLLEWLGNRPMKKWQIVTDRSSQGREQERLCAMYEGDKPCVQSQSE